MGCITRELKVAACRFRDERGSSFEYEEARNGEVRGVSQRLLETSDEESEGLSLLSSEMCSPPLREGRRPFWYLTLAKPRRSWRLRDTYSSRALAFENAKNREVSGRVYTWAMSILRIVFSGFDETIARGSLRLKRGRGP